MIYFSGSSRSTTSGGGEFDMLKSVYDKNNDGVVDLAQTLRQWEPDTNYVLDADMVTYDNNIWECADTHTSGATFDSSKWTNLSATVSSIDGGDF